MPKVKTYTPDFVLSNGVIVETKGRFDAADRVKHLALKQQYPDLDIRLVFQYDNPLTSHRLKKKVKKPQKVQRYSTWCQREGIPFAIGTIPKEWGDEANNTASLAAIKRVLDGATD